MRLETRDLLFDVVESGRRIGAYTAGLDAASFLDADLVVDAVKWNFLIVGEALNSVRKAEAALIERISEWNRVIAFRHQLAHGYDDIDDGIVWRIVQEKLPILLREVEALLAAPDTDDPPDALVAPT